MNKRIKIKTKPNLKIMALFSIILFLGIVGIVSSLFIKDTNTKLLLIILGTLLILLSIIEIIGLIYNYEEIDNKYFIVHRLSKRRTIPINNIKIISFNGIRVKLIDDNELEICNIDPRKDNLFPLLEILKNNGTEYLDNLH